MKKIMLCCNAGMSTSLLVQKMQSEVASRGLDIEVEARPMNEAHDHLDECDILLLGPQIGYTKGDFEKEAAGRFPVEVINMVDYGRMKLLASSTLRQRDGLGAAHGGYERAADDLL